MPILAIVQQPGSPSVPKIAAAYRPIVFLVNATRTDNDPVPPRVYCDIYINDQFYKTISSTQYKLHFNTYTQWEFDISSVCQQYFSFHLNKNGGTMIENSAAITAPVYCKFRSSGFDGNGILAPEGLAPKQGTGTKQPTNGTGTIAESFHVINALLQHEHNQDLQTHLQYARPNGSFEANTFPLTHRNNNYRICKGDSDHYPFIHLGDKPFVTISVVARNKYSGQNEISNYNFPQTCSSVVSGLTAVVVPGNDVRVNFNSSGPATRWEWTIDGGTTWNRIESKGFWITWEDLLIYLITESGQQILMEDGQIIVPEELDPFKQYTLTVRPRCSNGAYGTSQTINYSITQPLTCDPVSQFDYAGKDDTARTISHNITLPAGKNEFEWEWSKDYGNGFYSTPVIETYKNVGTQPFVWNVPAGERGKFRFRVRTKCGDNSYSAWSYYNSISFNPVFVELRIIAAELSSGAGNWVLEFTLQGGTSSSPITFSGYFIGDREGGGTQVFNFTGVIPEGQTDAMVVISGAPSGGIAHSPVVFTSASPNPTPEGYPIDL